MVHYFLMLMFCIAILKNAEWVARKLKAAKEFITSKFMRTEINFMDAPIT